MNTKMKYSIFSSQHQNRGFTFLELVISVAIFSILSGVAFTNYSRFNQRQGLIAAGQTMKNVLRDAQSRTFTSEIDCSVCNCTSVNRDEFLGWFVDITKLEIYGKCANKTFSEKSFGLSPDIFITPYPVIDGFLFRTTPPGISQQTIICLTKSDLPGLFYKLTVETSGNIIESGNLDVSCSP